MKNRFRGLTFILTIAIVLGIFGGVPSVAEAAALTTSSYYITYSPDLDMYVASGLWESLYMSKDGEKWLSSYTAPSERRSRNSAMTVEWLPKSSNGGGRFVTTVKGVEAPGFSDTYTISSTDGFDWKRYENSYTDEKGSSIPLYLFSICFDGERYWAVGAWNDSPDAYKASTAYLFYSTEKDINVDKTSGINTWKWTKTSVSAIQTIVCDGAKESGQHTFIGKFNNGVKTAAYVSGGEYKLEFKDSTGGYNDIKWYDELDTFISVGAGVAYLRNGTWNKISLPSSYAAPNTLSHVGYNGEKLVFNNKNNNVAEDQAYLLYCVPELDEGVWKFPTTLSLSNYVGVNSLLKAKVGATGISKDGEHKPFLFWSLGEISKIDKELSQPVFSAATTYSTTDSPCGMKIIDDRFTIPYNNETNVSQRLSAIAYNEWGYGYLIDQTFDWEILECTDEKAKINAVSGVLNLPSDTDALTVKVKATSKVYPDFSAEKTLTIFRQPPPPLEIGEPTVKYNEADTYNLSHIKGGMTATARTLITNHSSTDGQKVRILLALYDNTNNERRLKAISTSVSEEIEIGQSYDLNTQMTFPEEITSENEENYYLRLYVVDDESLNPMAESLELCKKQMLVYAMDYAPHEETDEDIIQRENFLKQRWADFFDYVDAQIASGNEEALITYLDAASSEDFDAEVSFALVTQYGYDELREPLISALKEGAANSLQTAKSLLDKEDSVGIWDLDTVHPSRFYLQKMLMLQELGEYKDDIKATCEEFIESYVENKNNYYDGTYETTGYNKEIFALDIASMVKKLYEDEPYKYPYTNASFEQFWYGVMHKSYEVDNSPHYDGDENLRIIIKMAMRHGDKYLEEVKASPDVKRIIFRMAQTVMSSGQQAQWGRNSFNYNPANDAYYIHSGSHMPWCLMWGYRFYGDPQLLYVARKHMQFELNNKTNLSVKDYIYLNPVDINYFDVELAKPLPDTPYSVTTHRISSNWAYGAQPGIPGGLLGRGDTDFSEVQDKLVLSTGFNPKSPYVLMDLSYTQSKAQADHRMVINNYIFDGVHVGTSIGRPRPGISMNRIFVSPVEYKFGFVDVGGILTEENEPRDYNNAQYDAYLSALGYSDFYGYEIGDYCTYQLSEDAAYGMVEYKKCQYDGVHTRREMVLLNNGIMVIKDKIWADENYTGGKNAGIIYNLWGNVTETGDNWWLQSAHPKQLTTGLDLNDGNKALYYIAPMGDDYISGLSANNKLYQYAELTSEKDVETVSVIVPLPLNYDAGEVGNRIICNDTDDGTEVIIPYDNINKIIVTFNDGMLAEYRME